MLFSWKSGLLKFDDGIQPVPGDTLGQSDFVLVSFLFKPDEFSVSGTVHNEGRSREFFPDIFDEQGGISLQLFSLSGNQRADVQVNGFFAVVIRSVATAAP